MARNGNRMDCTRLRHWTKETQVSLVSWERTRESFEALFRPCLRSIFLVLSSVVRICASHETVIIASISGAQGTHTSIFGSSFGPAVESGESRTPGHALVE